MGTNSSLSFFSFSSFAQTTHSFSLTGQATATTGHRPSPPYLSPSATTGTNSSLYSFSLFPDLFLFLRTLSPGQATATTGHRPSPPYPSSYYFKGGKKPTGTPSLPWSCVVVICSLLAGASVVHNIYKPNLSTVIGKSRMGRVITDR
ncbi:hypothetical protein TSUD_172530 [Trifolium subterraneum]|uniref:Uncharacterized protein n=1 Tax=Trifolium subterraneum TaxID=3900 RepID=A0A2Z6MJ50_TRISU|nr:hypothetical protein TSUD_172530 [Trifolium subterraneum]